MRLSVLRIQARSISRLNTVSSSRWTTVHSPPGKQLAKTKSTGAITTSLLLAGRITQDSILPLSRMLLMAERRKMMRF
ncbi:hypothetical protein AB66_4656 [Escherichia coli 5-172-05_S1_C3]|nr:hypothetical protein AB66_4656 [Escherichia coli 5-172-05_S1_C3]